MTDLQHQRLAHKWNVDREIGKLTHYAAPIFYALLAPLLAMFLWQVIEPHVEGLLDAKIEVLYLRHQNHLLSDKMVRLVRGEKVMPFDSGWLHCEYDPALPLVGGLK